MFKCAVELPAPVRFAVAIATVFRELHEKEKEQRSTQVSRALNEAMGNGFFNQFMEQFSAIKSSLIPIMPQRIEWEDKTATQSTKKAQREMIRFEVTVTYSLGTRVDLVVRCHRSPDIDKAISWKVEAISMFINEEWKPENVFFTSERVVARFIEIGLDPRLVDGYQHSQQANA